MQLLSHEEHEQLAEQVHTLGKIAPIERQSLIFKNKKMQQFQALNPTVRSWIKAQEGCLVVVYIPIPWLKTKVFFYEGARKASYSLHVVDEYLQQNRKEKAL